MTTTGWRRPGDFGERVARPTYANDPMITLLPVVIPIPVVNLPGRWRRTGSAA